MAFLSFLIFPDLSHSSSRCEWELNKRGGLSLNSTKCGNILDNRSTLIRLSSEKSGSCTGQSAGKKYASETTRGTLDHKFLEWFIGFTEGDGSFIVNRNGYLEFKVTQSSNDAQILFYIKKNLGFGSVSKQCKSSNTHHYRVRDRRHLNTIIHIFNGKLHLNHRQKQFEKFIYGYNEKYHTNIVCLTSQAAGPEFLKSSWLSGFIDAEGCFTASIIKRTNSYHQVQVRFILSQKNEQDFLQNLTHFINGRLSYLESYDGWNLTINLTKLNKIISYLSTHPLKTKKNIDFLNWLKIYRMVKNKEHFHPVSLDKIRKLKLKLNQVKI